MKKYALIVAGGNSTRMKSGAPKQFMLLGGKPVLYYSLAAFHEAVPDIEIILVLPSSHFDTWDTLLKQHPCYIPHRLAPGGETRFHSVKNGLDLIPGDGFVAIHDGARPVLSPGLIFRCFDAAREKGNAIPALPVNESLRQIAGSSSQPVDRSRFRIIQTPQVFRVAEIRKAYETPFDERFTDDATVLENAGKEIFLVKGSPENIKITRPEDLAIAQAFITRPFHL